MYTSKNIHLRPEEALAKVIENQKSIQTSKLKELLAPVLDKLLWQAEALARNVLSIRKLSNRAQVAEAQLGKVRKTLANTRVMNKELRDRAFNAEKEMVRKVKAFEKCSATLRSWEKRATKAEAKNHWDAIAIDRSSEAYKVLEKQLRQSEEQLRRAKLTITGLEMDARVAKQSGR